MQKIENYIGGKLLAPISENYLDNFNPATGEIYSLIPDSDERDVESAVEAAKKAFPVWSKMSAEERHDHLIKISNLIERDLDALAEAESVDNGKPKTLAKSVDIPRAVSNFKFYATAAMHFSSRSARNRRASDQLHSAPTFGRGRLYFAVEFAALSFQLENCARARRRMHGRRQTFGNYADDRLSFVKTLHRSRICPKAF